jgi:hypothetical protein
MGWLDRAECAHGRFRRRVARNADERPQAPRAHTDNEIEF